MGKLYIGTNKILSSPPLATSTSAGLMSAEDKAKIDELSSGGGSSSVSGDYLPLSGGTLTGALGIHYSETTTQDNVLVATSNLNSTTDDTSWVGRSLFGAENLTFLLGTYKGLAAIGAHSWTSASTQTGASWAPIYINPDGSQPIYMGANGDGWTSGTGTLIVQGSTTASGGTLTSNGLSYFNNSVIITTNSQPQLTLNNSAGNWDYIRINNGSNLWDIASNSNGYSGALQLRSGGGDSCRTIFNTDGRVEILTNSTGNNSLALFSNGQESSITYRDKSSAYTNWTVGRGTGGIGSGFGFWNDSRNVMWIENTGIVHIGTAARYNELKIHGTTEASGTGIQDGNDRPSIKLTGNYPQLIMMSAVSNGNHGPVISIGAFDDASNTSGSFKAFSIGTPGVNATYLDVGCGTSTNPHVNGISGYGTQIVRLNNNQSTQFHGLVEIFPEAWGNWGEGLRMHAANNGWTSLTLCGTDNTGQGGTSANSWSLHAYGGNFYIAKQGSSSGTQTLQNVNNVWYINGYVPYTTANITSGTADLTAGSSGLATNSIYLVYS